MSSQVLVVNKVFAINKIDSFEGSDESIEKCEKLSKTKKLSRLGKSKNEKMSKSQNLAKSGKSLSKSGNLTNFNATEDGPKFLTPDARTAFNHLWLAFTEAPILWHFDSKCHIWIETDASGYTIGGVLS